MQWYRVRRDLRESQLLVLRRDTVRTGGSIPVCTILLQNLGVHTVNFGFGLEDEHIHAPNEFFRLSSFSRGQMAYCKLLHKLGE